MADGQVATTWGAIYTAPGSTKAILRSVDFFNTNAATQTLEIRIIRSGGTARQTIRIELLQNETARLLTDSEVLVLSTGDAIQAQTTTATAVDFTITGATE